MTDEIHDELLNPGCPQCARKHLESALVYLLQDGNYSDDTMHMDVWRGEPTVPLARALINYAECVVGYESHIILARGFLEQFEEKCAHAGDARTANWARQLRFCMTEDPKAQAGTVHQVLQLPWAPTIHRFAWAVAHFLEAIRELPDLEAPIETFGPRHIYELLGKVEHEYFSLALTPKKGGEYGNKSEGSPS